MSFSLGRTWHPWAFCGLAASIAAGLLYLGPPGTDFAAHIYQRHLFITHGFTPWTNLWYSGHYSFITYSLLYYPFAALLGIRLLAIFSVAAATLAFSLLLQRKWEQASTWPSCSFAVLWGGFVLSGAFPFALGIGFGLLSLLALRSQARWRFALLCTLTLAASPLAFLLIVLLMAAIGLADPPSSRRLVWPIAVVGSMLTIQVALLILFRTDGQYPFSTATLVPPLIFCVGLVSLSWRVEGARLLRFVGLVYGAACLAAYLVGSPVGGNIARFRYAAVPVILLALALRRWKPVPISVVAVTLAGVWNVVPLAAGYVNATGDSSSHADYWRPAVAFLHTHLAPSYRVEAVDTTHHWAAVYMPENGIPLARGWFRQDDFPTNELLYDRLRPASYISWLHGLGVKYVVLSDAPLDYSARAEAALLRRGKSGLRRVLATRHLTIYEVPAARALVTGPGLARVRVFEPARLQLVVARPGRYRLAVHYSPYWRLSRGCMGAGKDGMIRLAVASRGFVSLRFDVSAQRAFAALRGEDEQCGSAAHT